MYINVFMLAVIKFCYQMWVVPLNLAGVLMDPVEQWKVEVRGVVVTEFSAGSPLDFLIVLLPVSLVTVPS